MSLFKAAELGRQVSREDYEKRLPKLRLDLLQAQRGLREAGVPVILVLSGADGAGKSEVVHRLHEWLDPRGLETNAYGPPSDEERERPPYWRFWRTLPAKGRIGVFFGSWYTDPLLRRAYRELSVAKFERELRRVASFERMLVDGGALVVKFLLHLPKRAQRKRLLTLEKSPDTRWRVSPLEWKHYRLYGRFLKASEQAVRSTDTPATPWFVIEATDERYRELMLGRILLGALRRRLKEGPPRSLELAPGDQPLAPPAVPGAAITVLDNVDLSQRVSGRAYRKRLARLQARLNRLTREAALKQVSSVVVLEGWDASGKGGAIRRIAEAIDPRRLRVIPIAAPSDEEKAHHYLWRFWRQLPRAGFLTIYDRSWYGRVLVERVERFATQPEWMRAYREINDFEEQLVEHGVVLAKLWIHISPDEQLRRFERRRSIPHKRHKLGAEDWRNREKWQAYRAAVSEMVVRTSTRAAPWTLVAGEQKRFARLFVLETLCDSLERAL